MGSNTSCGDAFGDQIDALARLGNPLVVGLLGHLDQAIAQIGKGHRQRARGLERHRLVANRHRVRLELDATGGVRPRPARLEIHHLPCGVVAVHRVDPAADDGPIVQSEIEGRLDQQGTSRGEARGAEGLVGVGCPITSLQVGRGDVVVVDLAIVERYRSHVVQFDSPVDVDPSPRCRRRPPGEPVDSRPVVAERAFGIGDERRNAHLRRTGCPIGHGRLWDPEETLLELLEIVVEGRGDAQRRRRGLPPIGCRRSRRASHRSSHLGTPGRERHRRPCRI